jgi:hypothetical protein
METPVLNTAQNLIVSLLRKYKPELAFTIADGENNIPEIILEYGIVSNIPEGVDQATIINEPQKMKIPLEDTMTWVNMKKWIDIFEKYMKNVDLNKRSMDVSAQILQLESMKNQAIIINDQINKNKKNTYTKLK